jgi:hypothetical protein
MNDEMASGRRSIYSNDKLPSVTGAEPAPASTVRRAGEE